METMGTESASVTTLREETEDASEINKNPSEYQDISTDASETLAASDDNAVTESTFLSPTAAILPEYPEDGGTASLIAEPASYTEFTSPETITMTGTVVSNSDHTDSANDRKDVPMSVTQSVRSGASHGHFMFGSSGGDGNTGFGGGHRGGGGSGGEGLSHLALKKHLAENPSLLGSGLKLVEEEHRFKCADTVDILLIDENGGPVTVEVEAEIAPQMPVRHLAGDANVGTLAAADLGVIVGKCGLWWFTSLSDKLIEEAEKLGVSNVSSSQFLPSWLPNTLIAIRLGLSFHSSFLPTTGSSCHRLCCINHIRSS